MDRTGTKGKCLMNCEEGNRREAQTRHCHLSSVAGATRGASKHQGGQVHALQESPNTSAPDAYSQRPNTSHPDRTGKYSNPKREVEWRAKGLEKKMLSSRDLMSSHRGGFVR